MELVVFDAVERQVRTLVDASLPSGSYDVGWDALSDAGNRVAARVYFVRLETRSGETARKLVLTR